MKALCCFLMALFSLASAGRAEIFFGPTSATNRLIVQAGEAIFVSSVLPDDPVSGPATYSLVVSNQGIETVYPPVPFMDQYGNGLGYYRFPPIVMAGPFEIRSTNSFAISFSRVQNSITQTLIVPTNATATISVPANKMITFFNSLRGDIRVGPIAIQNTNGIPQLTNSSFSTDSPISGPVNLKVLPTGDYRILTYAISSDVIANPQVGAVSGGNGKAVIVVEKSSNLMNWVPILQSMTEDDQASFYRFRIHP